MRADDDDVLGTPSSFLKASSKGLLFLAPLPLVTTVAPPPSSTSVRCWCLYFIDALLVVGDTISNAGRRHYQPSLLWGFLPPKGVGWRYAAFGCAPPVLPSARREIVVSCDVLVRLLLPTLSPHSVGKPSQFVGGWPQDGVAAMGVVVALWLWRTWQVSISEVAPSEDHHSPLRVCNHFPSLLVFLWILLLLHKS